MSEMVPETEDLDAESDAMALGKQGVAVSFGPPRCYGREGQFQ